MTATSHATIGALIATFVKRPEIALPLAFLSHFVADAIPHYGIQGHAGFGEALKHKSGKFVGITDPILLVSLFALLFYLGVPFYVFAAALLACSPDLEWLFAFLVYERRNKKAPRSFIAPLHNRIQWCEKPWGYASEVIVIVFGTILLVNYWL
jgi:hypothetical protein